ncbi:uncharacterized protein [Lepeophtheirus salmonis]|uniref:uncharacterized protein n=1 Tax=Lepeophtheirus salmonis TaxID=72036 RepID=UPI001AE5F146|nr:AT-rich interactive domain-containing protein 4A-like [Lepeophtheirus salmonis]
MEVPASLSIGTQVSAKYKGAFCEAKVKSVVKQVKCRVTFGLGLGSATLSDELMKYEGNLGVGSVVEARHPEKQEYLQATVNKIQDQSQYTVVFDDGDITSLRRNALCMKSGKHYNASESLDNLPLTHPEHFSTPVSGSRRRKRGHKESENEESSSSDNEEGVSSCYLTNIGRVVWTENTENKKSKVKETWFPALIVAPSASDTVKINTKEEFLIRSFKDGRYYTVRKKDTNQFKKDSPKKSDNPLIKEAMEKAISYIETKELPPHWDKEHLFNMGGAEESTTESSESEEIEDDEDEESREEKDHLVAELYKHMEDRGAPINRTPNIVGKDLDLYKLFRIVYKYGGHQRVTNNNKWRQIAHKLGFETTWCVNQVRVNYKRYLQSFEELYKTLGCTMKSGSTSKQRQGSGNGSSGRVQIRGRSREMLKQQLSSSKDSSNSSHNEDTASDSSKETPSISSTKFIVNTANENTVVEKVVVSAPKKPSSEESSKEDSEEVEEVKLPVSTSKKSIKDKKTSTSASKSDSLIKKSKDEAKFVGTRNRRDSNSSSVSGTIQIKTQKDDITPGPSAKKSLTKELSEIDIGKKPTKSSSTSKLIESSGDEPLKILKGRKKHKESKKTVSSISTTPVITSVNSSSANNLSTTVNLSTPIISSEDTSDIKSRSSDSVGEEEPQYLSPDVDVRVGDKIKVFYIRGIIYDAKVIKCQEQEKNNSKWPRYYVHYQGWNARYDEWINRSRIAENLSWTKDRPRKDGKEDSSDGSIDKSFKKEKSKVDGRKERKIVKRDSTSRASTPAKSYGDQSPASSNKRGVRSVKKMESDISDAEEEDSEKSSSKKGSTPIRVTTKKNVTPISQKRGRGRKRKEESENEEVEVEKDLNEETVDITSSPTKAKRGRKSTKESQVPTASSIISTICSVSKKEEAEEPQSSIVNDESPSKRSLNRVTPIREQRPSVRSSISTKIKDSDKKSSIKKEDESVDKESKFTKNIDEEDPYAFKEPEPFEEVKFETPPRKVSTPPTTNTTTTAAFIPQKNLENDLLSVKPSKESIKKEVSILMDDSLLEKNNEKGITADQPKVVEDNTTTPAPVRAAITLSKLEEEEDDVDDSDEEGKLEIVTPKKDSLEDSPNKSISNEDNLIQPHGDQLKESIEQPSVIIEIKKSLDKPTDDPGKPVLQLTEKQKELFPFLSAIRTASLGSISSSSVEGTKDESSSQEIKIEVMTSPSKKPVVVPNTNSTTTTLISASTSTTTAATITTTTSTSTSVVGSSGSNVNVKKRKSNRRFNSSELVIESESESDEEDIKPKEQINIVKDIIDIPINSTKNVTIKKLIKKDHDVDDVDLVCAETIPGSPVHPGISDSNFTEEEEEIRTSKSEKVNKVVEVKKLEMPFATVPESGLGPAVPDVPKPPTPSLSSIATKKISSKTEKKELETVLVSSTSTKLPSIAQPTASIVKDNNNLPTSLTNEPPSEPPPPLPPKSPTGDSTSDIDSMSGKIKLEVEDSRCLDVEGSSSGDAPTNPTAVFSSNRRNTGLKRRLVEKLNDAPRSPAQKRKRRPRDVANASTSALSTLSRYRGSTRGRHSSGRGVGIRGNLDDETDESEEPKDSTLNSLSSLDDQALVALSQRSPKSSRYNFYVDLDPAMDSSERISLIQQNLEELRKTYLNIKSDLALIERRRKKIRRKERERGSNSINSSSSGSNSGSSKNNPAHIEVTA